MAEINEKDLNTTEADVIKEKEKKRGFARG